MRGECKAKQAGFQMKNYREVPNYKFPINPYIPILTTGNRNFSKSVGIFLFLGGAMRVSFLKVAKPYLISLNGGLALKLI